MSRYVDGFLLPLPKDNVEAYREMAELAGKVWREHGALEYIECLADDVQPGEITSFPQSVKLEPDETVVFAWIIYQSREDRDRVNEAAMKDPRLSGMGPQSMPFDGKRMIWGGFTELVSA
jgi:uncharacterized protein YbaA (DUF1428 family)